MYLATLQTAHYDFVALGQTEAHAIHSLEQAWEVHAEQTGASAFAEFSDGVNLSHIVPGMVLRDGERLWDDRQKRAQARRIAQGQPCNHSESLYGRCTACGMTWQAQAEARTRRTVS